MSCSYKDNSGNDSKLFSELKLYYTSHGFNEGTAEDLAIKSWTKHVADADVEPDMVSVYPKLGMIDVDRHSTAHKGKLTLTDKGEKIVLNLTAKLEVSGDLYREVMQNLSSTALDGVLRTLLSSGLANVYVFTPNKKTRALNLEGFVNKNNDIYISKDFNHQTSTIISHELIHRITTNYYNTNAEFKRKIDSLLEIAREKMVGDAYGLTNGKEFIAEALTNSVFAEKLRNTLIGGKDRYAKKSILARIIDMVLNAFGSPISSDVYHNENVYENFIKTLKVHESSIVKTINEKAGEVTYFSNDVQFGLSYEETKHYYNVSNFIIIKNILDGNITDGNLKEYIIKVIRTKNKVLTNEGQKKTNEKFIEALEKDNELWDSIRHNFNKEFRLDLTSEENPEELITKQWDDTKSFGEVLKNRLSSRARFKVATIAKKSATKNDKGVYPDEISPISGLPEFLSFETINPYLYRSLSNLTTKEEYIETLTKLSEYHPDLRGIIKLIKEDSSFFSSLYSTLRTMSPKKSLWLINESEAKKTYSNSNSDIGNQLTEAMMQVIDGGIEQGTYADTTLFTEVAGVIRAIEKNIAQHEEGNADQLRIISNLIQYAYNKLGITEVSAKPFVIETNYSRVKARTYLTENGLTPLKTLYSYIIDADSRNRTNLFRVLSKVGKMQSNMVLDKGEGSYLNHANDLEQTYNRLNFISMTFSSIFEFQKNPTDANEDKVLAYAKSLALDGSMQYSNIMWTENGRQGFLISMDGTKNPETAILNTEFINNIKYEIFDALKNTDSNSSFVYKSSDSTNYNIFALLEFGGNMNEEYSSFPIPIPSDSGNMYTVTLPNTKFEKDEIEIKKVKGKSTKVTVTRGSAAFISLKNTIMQEVHRMTVDSERIFKTKLNDKGETIFDLDENDNLQVKENLNLNEFQLNVHFNEDREFLVPDEDGKMIPTGRVFQFLNLQINRDNEIQTLEEFIGLDVPILTETQLPNFGEAINKFIESFINHEINETIALFESQGMAEYKDRFNTKGLTFEHYVANFTVSHIVANIAMNNLFIGNFSEYKSVLDYNKRVKQIISPTTKLDTSEIAKHYSNITVSDIYATSDELADMIQVIHSNMDTKKKIRKTKILGNLLKGQKTELSSVEQAIYNIIEPYANIESTDGQGYITIKRFKDILTGLGRYEDFRKTIEAMERGDTLLPSDIDEALYAIKGFYFNREFDENTGHLRSTQVKYSSIPLIPQLVNGVPKLEALRDLMESKQIDEVIFASAQKVGQKNIQSFDNIADSDVQQLSNDAWGFQLDVPNHFEDNQNKIGLQISKLFHANINPTAVYSVSGKEYFGNQLKEHFFDVYMNIIKNNVEKLMSDLGGSIEFRKDNNGYKVTKAPTNEAVKALLLDRLDASSSDNNIEFLLATTPNGDFNLPLYISSSVSKMENLFTSMFTKKGMEQQFDGITAVVTSDAMFDFNNTTDEFDINDSSINFTEEFKTRKDKTLKFEVKKGKLIVEAILPRWNSKFYNKNVVEEELSEEATKQAIEDLIKSGDITFTEEDGKPCAEKGLKPSNFTKGGEWEVIKEFKGLSHERGGIDITIGKGKISMNGKQGEFKASNGLVISAKSYEVPTNKKG